MKKSHDIDQVLSDLQSFNPSNLNFRYLNINSTNIKFTDFQEIINGDVDVASIAETKIDVSFPSARFIFEGYHWLHCLDVSSKNRGILVHEKSAISSRRQSCENLCNTTQAVPFKSNLRKEKWLVISIYGSSSQSSEYFLNNLTKMIEFFADA